MQRFQYGTRLFTFFFFQGNCLFVLHINCKNLEKLHNSIVWKENIATYFPTLHHQTKSLYSFFFKVQTKSCAEELYLRDCSSLSWVCDTSMPLCIPCKIQVLNCLVNYQAKSKSVLCHTILIIKNITQWTSNINILKNSSGFFSLSVLFPSLSCKRREKEKAAAAVGVNGIFAWNIWKAVSIPATRFFFLQSRVRQKWKGECAIRKRLFVQ